MDLEYLGIVITAAAGLITGVIAATVSLRKVSSSERKDAIASLQEEVARLTARVLGLEQDRGRLEARNRYLESQIDLLVSERAALRIRVEELEYRIKRLQDGNTVSK